MISFLRGTVRGLDHEDARAVIEVNGVGYGVLLPPTHLNQLPEEGSMATIYTYLHVREDILRLYGFFTRTERDAFEMLTGVSKIGPKLALATISTLQVEQLRRAVLFEDTATLKEVSGIGPKTAERLLLELKDKVASLPQGEEVAATVVDRSQPGERNNYREAKEALISLGYSSSEADEALRDALRGDGDETNVEEMVRKALLRLDRSDL